MANVTAEEIMDPILNKFTKSNGEKIQAEKLIGWVMDETGTSRNTVIKALKILVNNKKKIARYPSDWNKRHNVFYGINKDENNSVIIDKSDFTKEFKLTERKKHTYDIRGRIITPWLNQFSPISKLDLKHISVKKNIYLEDFKNNHLKSDYDNPFDEYEKYNNIWGDFYVEKSHLCQFVNIY